ncbi:MAG TPA: 30S ribosomal protein S20 [Candidatus Eisenbacteria bacterium]|uniref:Small ribosomal subunit protein bS20 n=1 Tax=Eiseniibacteriota bacterium TaxID=2212470 RepID=A0A7V2AVQ1_UNCEI|nr:30S ribosomal protein S20 [Candidatus Eisenbacteria bacterium]
MPNHKSAEKRMRQNEKRRMTNKKHRSLLRKEIKEFKAIEDSAKASESFSALASRVDKSAKMGIIHHRTAARIKSRLSKKTL